MTPAERRKYSRMPLSVEAQLSDFRDGRWTATTLDVSPFGAKIALEEADTKTRPGDSLRCRLASPDGGAPIEAMVSVVRADRGTIAVAFVNLTMEDFRRLAQLVDVWIAKNPSPR